MMTRVKEIGFFLMNIVLFCLALFAALTGGFFLSGLIYKHFGTPSSVYVAEILRMVLILIILFFLMAIIGLATRGQERNFYNPIINAIRQITRGDFKVVLENNKHFGQFGVIVEGINEMAVELNRMESMRQDFISNVSHEIQSPLTSIRGFAKALRDENISAASRKHYLDIIEAESSRLSGLSDNLLKLSALEEGSFPFERKSYRLDKQLRDMIVACEPQWLEKELEVEADLDEVTVTASQDLMNQVWSNLLHNSIKFTPAGGSIKVELTTRGQEIEVVIKDSGIGIAEQDLQRVFERFFKADQARSSNVGGSGLGLSLVKKIVDIHGGAITVTSRPGEGTAFVIRLNSQTLLD
ncbi:sensor histidine kinase [Paenibacillus wynnii]|uniref:sensor histidine kinase n=1 Tax=Paenibacillus wynnii TaxID=268407 RepID=UPI0027916475|nr:HAMP domain-containing sensor histidine kinase [Paenibacillus wynnii]MDQ0192254.1 signal transduction histidine kinase [Paenibacillus wynnii]